MIKLGKVAHFVHPFHIHIDFQSDLKEKYFKIHFLELLSEIFSITLNYEEKKKLQTM